MKTHRVRCAAVTGLVLWMTVAALQAAEPPPSAFDAAYALALEELKHYRATGFLVGLSERPATVEAVTNAYEMGKRREIDPIVRAELTANYASVRVDLEEAETLLKQAIALIKPHENEDNAALIRPLMSIAHLNYEFNGLNGADRYYKRALALGDQFWPGELRLADLYLEAAVQLSANSHITARNYLGDALEIYGDLSGPEAIEGLAATNMHLGRYFIRRGQFIRAERALQQGLATLGDNRESAAFVGLHTQLVRLYVDMHKPELAAQHSQIIGSTYAGQANDELIPLYTVSPRYPPNALRLREAGEVTVGFTVNAQGEVVDPVVIERTGHYELEGAALDAIKAARYAPRFENGSAVATENVRFTYRFGIIE